MISECLGINEIGHLTIGGLDVAELAAKFGTPLYLMDEDLIRKTCREYRDAMEHHFDGNCLVTYASKAFCAGYMYKILAEEGLGADVVSGGELYTALCAGFDASRIFFHGNNKTREEMVYAVRSGVGHIIVDNREELHLLNSIACEEGKIVDIMFRIKPGVDAHTHEFIQTGKIDSKFGVALENGEAFDIVKESLKLDNVRLAGVHCHIGSQIFESDPFELAARIMMEFIARVQRELGYEIRELDLGGGFGIKYLQSHDPKTPEENIAAAARAVKNAAAELGVAVPHVSIEPGRAIVAPAGITVYTIGSVKEIKNVRNYVAIDGGMTDNPRYTLYEAAYEVVCPTKMNAPRDYLCTVAGRCCESGDLIAKDTYIQPVEAGDLLCVLATGAYNYSMASNYNRVPRPPVVMVSGGEAKVVVRRESFEDLVRNDII